MFLRKLKEKSKEFLNKAYYCSFLIAIVDIICIANLRFFDIQSKFSRKLFSIKHRLIQRYLMNKGYISLMIDGGDDIYIENYNDEININYVWVFWAQGEEKAPFVIKKCLESIRRHCKNKEVIILDYESCKSYIEIPDYIENKIIKGNISWTQFSDILRVSLLEKYGGLWIDAGLYLTKDIEEILDFNNFFTIRFPDIFNRIVISKCRWVGGFMFSNRKNYRLFYYLRKFFYEYWKHENVLIDFFLIDYALDIILKKHVDLKNDIDIIPYNNSGVFLLDSKWNDKFLKDEYEEIIKKTAVHRLSYKKKYYPFTEKKEITFYGSVILGIK